MSCYSQDELRAYLRRELPAESQAGVEEHLDACGTCCEAVDKLASDDLVREFFDAARRDAESVLKREDDSLPTRALDGPLPDWQPLTADTPLPLRFGRFVLREVLGKGGFGIVYRADDINLEREVAVKIPHLGGLSPNVRSRFLREGMAAANLHHPHIVQVFQSGTHRGICFLVSEYCPGKSLRRLLDETTQPFDTEQAAWIVLHLAEAAEHAHQNGVVHRDIKPANVILDARAAPEGLPYCPKLADFGTAKLLGDRGSRTTTGQLIGTAPYMAPEQMSGSGKVTPATDVYALGVLLYELVAGHVPVAGSDSADAIRQVLTFEPRPLHRVRPEVSRDLSAICACCLEKAPARRYASARLLAADLRRFLNHEPTLARPLPPAARLLRWSRRNPQPLAVMAAICLAFFLVAAGLAWHTSQLRDLNNQLLEANRQTHQLLIRAERSERHTQRLRYASDMRLAEKSWREGDPRTVRAMLDRYVPAAEEPDLRGVEWYFLRRAVRPEAEEIAHYGSPLYCVRLSPDEKRFAVAGEDAVIRIHQRDTGKLLQSIPSDQGEVNGLAFSPDSQTLASTGDDGSVCLWKLPEGSLVKKFAAHEGLAFGVEFTPDGRRLVTCGTDHRVCLWENDGRRVAVYEDHLARVEAIAVSPDGQWLASAGKDRRLMVRDMRTGKVQFQWDAGHGTLSGVAFSPDSRTLAVVEASGATKCLRLLDSTTGEILLTREQPDGIRCVAYSPDGERVLTSDNAGIVRLWAVRGQSESEADAKPLRIWPAHASRIYAMAFEPNGQSALSVGQDGRVLRLEVGPPNDHILLDTQRLARLTKLHEEYLHLHDVAFHPNGRQLVVASYIAACLVNLDNSPPEVQFRRVSGNHFCAHLAVSTSDGPIALAECATRDALQSDQGVTSFVESMVGVTTPRRKLLSVRGNDQVADLHYAPGGELLAVTIGQQHPERGDKQLMLLDARTGQVQLQFPAANGTKARFTHDGRWMLFNVQRDLHLVELASGRHEVVPSTMSSAVNGIAVSHDDRWLALVDESRDLVIWDLPARKPHRATAGHQGLITAVVFSADDRTLLSSSQDGTVKAWNVQTGQHLMDLHVSEAAVNALALSPDGRRLAVVEEFQRLRLYDLGIPGPASFDGHLSRK